MASELNVVISGGQIRFVYNDDLLGLTEQGETKIRRASHVEPAPDGGWQADMSPVNGPILGPFEKRSVALHHEVEWLKAHDIPQPEGM
jgi:hypothetical protein